MNTPRPRRPGSGPLPRRPPTTGPMRPLPPGPIPQRTAAPDPGKGRWIAVVAGVIAAISATIALVPGKKPPAPEPVVESKPPPKIVPQAPPPPPTAPPLPAPVPEPPPPPKKPKQDPVEAKKAEMAEAARKQREEGATRVGDARKSVEQDLEREKKETEAFEKRFANFRADIKLTSNQFYKQALITGFTSDELRLKASESEAVNIPWSLVDPESIGAVANHVYRNPTADDLLALARFLVDRRMWKEAQAALHRLRKLDDEYENLAGGFDEAAAPLLTGKGHFQGALKTTGPTGLRLAYDFSDPAQADDFKGRSGGLTLENGTLTLEAEKHREWVIGDTELEFWDEFEIEGTASVQGALRVVFHWRPQGEFYIVELGPAGTVLKKGKTFLGAKELSNNAKAALKGEQKFRVTVRKRKIVVAIAGQPAFTYEDAAGEGETRGLVQIGVASGKAVLAKGLAVSGQVNPDYLKKKVGTVEMAARRSVNKELGEVRELTGKQLANLILGGGREGLSADLLLIEFLSVQELPDYDEVKAAVAGRHWDEEKHGGKELQEFLEGWIEKHGGFPSLWYLRGMLHLNRYELGEARDKFAKAIALFPDFYEARYQTAVAWQHAREFDKALDQVRQALALRPDYPNALILQAQMRFAVDKTAGAESDRDLRVAEKLGSDADQVLQLRRWVKIQTRGPRDLGCIFEVESNHYRIVTDISQDRATWYADQLEIVRGTYLDVFKKWYRDDPRPKPRIAIFNTKEAFYTYSELCSTNRHENALGFFDPANNELVLFEDLDLNETLETLYHEAFHHFASAMLKFPPYWWNEGIAEYMSGVRIDPEKKAVKERARTLRGRLGVVQSMARNDFFISFERLMNYTPSEFYSGPIGLHYAQAWAMLHFFYEYLGGVHRGLIERYFDELVGGKTQRQAYDLVFQGKTEKLEKDWLEFTKKLKPPATP